MGATAAGWTEVSPGSVSCKQGLECWRRVDHWLYNSGTFPNVSGSSFVKQWQLSGVVLTTTTGGDVRDKAWDPYSFPLWSITHGARSWTEVSLELLQF